MAIDFSQVKTVTIPEGPVCEITDPAGNILWEGVGWHTIWKGNKTCSVSANGTDAPVLEGAEDNFAQTKSGTGYTPKIRITYSVSRFNNNTEEFKNAYIVNGSWKNGTGSSYSRLVIEAVDNSADSVVIYAPAFYYYSVDPLYAYAGIRKRRDTENNRIIFDMNPYVTSDVNSQRPKFSAELTIKKIEQYY